MSTRTSKAVLLGALAALSLGAAADPALAAKRARAIDYSPVFAAEPLPSQANGAIYQAANGYSALTNGARAAMIGDIVTITLVERTQAAKSNSASTDRSGELGLTPPTTGPLSLFKPTDVGASGGSTFTGKGAAAQSNQLNGEISVSIVRVYPNGTMLVRGEKLLTLNRGDENIAITGLIRAADIGPDNRVPSTRVADARITYSGKGEIARGSRQGWLNRFFSILSPF
ncbi:flagellar basal body L-ring protein FlgH [Rhizorhabdus wittichii]|uniref:Flagellar L-ring protein n=1 Tax=Rhizorhabdus wittichii TaxID=160791 RepID=A0A975D2Z4_9SPHN|nr:flagellar basal body L-ring protein FlgH [Rhizorhabdus wittichii]ARR55605.1 flagellar biosynthesis protein FlgH [Rhizorhabdus wittichii DC-6]QTH21909.1 flagellar basal body L-ring protein FlgH [Rhizorhabdus wittichii]